jgi:integrase
VPGKPVPIVPADGRKRLFAACAGASFEARRDTALLMLLLYTGARRAEMVGLKLADVDLELDVLLVLARAAASGPCRLAARLGRRWTATCGLASATRMPSCRGCGLA